MSAKVDQDHPSHFSGSRSYHSCQSSDVCFNEGDTFLHLWFGRLIRSWGDGTIYSRHPDGHILLVTVGKNRCRRGQESDILDCQACLFHDFPLGAGFEAFAVFKMPTRMGDETWRMIRTLVSSQYAGYCQARTRSMASFPFADQNVIVCVASKDKDCNTDTGSGHDDSCPEQNLGEKLVGCLC